MRNKKIGYLHEKYWSPKKYADTKHIPLINYLLEYYEDHAKTIEEPDWYAKGVAIYFTYENEFYVIYPSDINTSSEKFEMLQNNIADDLYHLGAYDIFCDGMID